MTPITCGTKTKKPMKFYFAFKRIKNFATVESQVPEIEAILAAV